MGFLSVLSFAHQLVKERVRPGDTAIDATAGNGSDTLLLARLVGSYGRVIAFDVQAEALEHTRRKLLAAGVECSIEAAVDNDARSGAGEAGGSLGSCARAGAGCCRLVLASHAEMERYVESVGHGRVAAVMFNLGYLPGAANTALITRPDTTLPALAAALRLLRPGGVLTAALYPGHLGGREEADAVEAWAAVLPQQEAQTVLYRFGNAPISSPYLIAVEKKGSAAYNQGYNHR